MISVCQEKYNRVDLEKVNRKSTPMITHNFCAEYSFLFIKGKDKNYYSDKGKKIPKRDGTRHLSIKHFSKKLTLQINHA